MINLPKPRIIAQADVTVKGHDKKERAGKATTYTAIMKTDKGEDLTIEVKVTVKDHNLKARFPMLKEMTVQLVDVDTTLDEFEETVEEPSTETGLESLSQVEVPEGEESEDIPDVPQA